MEQEDPYFLSVTLYYCLHNLHGHAHTAHFLFLCLVSRTQHLTLSFLLFSRSPPLPNLSLFLFSFSLFFILTAHVYSIANSCWMRTSCCLVKSISKDNCNSYFVYLLVINFHCSSFHNCCFSDYLPLLFSFSKNSNITYIFLNVSSLLFRQLLSLRSSHTKSPNSSLNSLQFHKSKPKQLPNSESQLKSQTSKTMP